jgi:hypothetical protein
LGFWVIWVLGTGFSGYNQTTQTTQTTLKINLTRIFCLTLISSNKLYYDGNGNFIKYEFYNYKNAKRATQEFTLNSNRSVTEVRFLNPNDSLVQKFTQNYDNKNFLTSQVVEVLKPASTIIWKFTPLKYDERGNCTQFLQDEDNGKFRFITERTFLYY